MGYEEDFIGPTADWLKIEETNFIRKNLKSFKQAQRDPLNIFEGEYINFLKQSKINDAFHPAAGEKPGAASQTPRKHDLGKPVTGVKVRILKGVKGSYSQLAISCRLKYDKKSKIYISEYPSGARIGRLDLSELNGTNKTISISGAHFPTNKLTNTARVFSTIMKKRLQMNIQGIKATSRHQPDTSTRSNYQDLQKSSHLPNPQVPTDKISTTQPPKSPPTPTGPTGTPPQKPQNQTPSPLFLHF